MQPKPVFGFREIYTAGFSLWVLEPHFKHSFTKPDIPNLLLVQLAAETKWRPYYAYLLHFFLLVLAYSFNIWGFC